MVEFHQADDGVKLHGHRGFYQIYPIEYKKGKPKSTEEDILQVTAQTMCLEEMFSAKIEKSSSFLLVKQGEGKMLLLQGTSVSR